MPNHSSFFFHFLKQIDKTISKNYENVIKFKRWIGVKKKIKICNSEGGSDSILWYKSELQDKSHWSANIIKHTFFKMNLLLFPHILLATSVHFTNTLKRNIYRVFLKSRASSSSPHFKTWSQRVQISTRFQQGSKHLQRTWILILNVEKNGMYPNLIFFFFPTLKWSHYLEVFRGRSIKLMVFELMITEQALMCWRWKKKNKSTELLSVSKPKDFLL